MRNITICIACMRNITVCIAYMRNVTVCINAGAAYPPSPLAGAAHSQGTLSWCTEAMTHSEEPRSGDATAGKTFFHQSEQCPAHLCSSVLFSVPSRGRRGNAAHRVIPSTLVFLKMKILDDHLNVSCVDDITACGCGVFLAFWLFFFLRGSPTLV